MHKEIDALSTKLGATTSQPSNQGTIVTGATPAELLANAEVLLTTGLPPACLLRRVNTLLVELCASADSELTRRVPYGAAAIRVTEKEDLADPRTLRAILEIIRLAKNNGVKVCVWAATPCTSGCSWRHVNAARGLSTGDSVLSDKLIKNAEKVCRLARLLGGDYVWEWPATCDLWNHRRVKTLTSGQGHSTIVSASAVGWTALQHGRVVTVRKKWRLWTTHPVVASAFSPYQQDTDASAKSFVECSGSIAKSSAHYTKHFAEIFWNAVHEPRRSSSGAQPRHLVDRRKSDDSRPVVSWGSLVARDNEPTNADVRCEVAQKALRKELASMDSKKAWDLDDVFSLEDLLRHRDLPVATPLIGRVSFSVVSTKQAELGSRRGGAWEVRCAFHASDFCAEKKALASTAEVFEEASSDAPASFVVARAALGVAALKGYDVSLRDAEPAYLQASVGAPIRRPTFVELPRDVWPDAWFEDGAKRSIPKYSRPHCRLLKTMCGHPEARDLWEERLDNVMQTAGWTVVHGTDGAYTHAKTGAAMLVYAQDMMLLSPPGESSMLWRVLERNVAYKDLEAPVSKYLSALYNFDAYDKKKPKASRSMLTSMDDYAATAVRRFLGEYGKKLAAATSPYLSPEDYGKLGRYPGLFAPSAANHVATLMFLSRASRPDISLAVHRLRGVVTKWTTTHDAALIRLYAYLRSTGPIALHSELSPEDLQAVQLVAWSDADWCGDAEDTKSTSGLLLELSNPLTGRRWPLDWIVRRQPSTSTSKCEAETVALCHAAKREGLPVLSLLDALLADVRRPMELVAQVGNKNAIAVVTKGYSKKLRSLERTQKCSIGSVHELIRSGQLAVKYAPTLARRGNGLTKCLVPSEFLQARRMMSMVDASS